MRPYNTVQQMLQLDANVREEAANDKADALEAAAAQTAATLEVAAALTAAGLAAAEEDKVRPERHCLHHHPTHVNPHKLISVIPYDMARNVKYLAGPGTRRRRSRARRAR